MKTLHIVGIGAALAVGYMLFRKRRLPTATTQTQKGGLTTTPINAVAVNQSVIEGSIAGGRASDKSMPSLRLPSRWDIFQPFGNPYSEVAAAVSDPPSTARPSTYAF